MKRIFNALFVGAISSVILGGAANPGDRPGAARPGGLTAPGAPLRVVATLPVYAEIAGAIGGKTVEVSAIADPRQDAHFVQPRPSFALDIRRADLLISTGLDLELWLPALLNKAGNAAVMPGNPGYVSASAGVELLAVPENASRAQGDVHIFGNPHIYTDPLNMIRIARNVASGLQRVAPERSAVFERGLATFNDRIHRRVFGDTLVDMLTGRTLARLARSGDLFRFLEETPFQGGRLIDHLGGWLAAAEPFRGKNVICYHKNWAYFEARFHVSCAAFVEAKPGIPPTPGHVADLIALMRGRDLDVILAANYFDRAKVEAVATRAGATVVMVPLAPGGAPGVSSYFDVVDAWVNGLARAFAPTS